MLNKDVISGMFFLIVGASFLFGASRYPIWDRYGPGSGFFPLVLSLLFSILCFILLAERIIGHMRQTAPESPGTETRELGDKGRLFLCLGFFVLFYVTFERLGSLITIFVYMLGVLALLGKRSFRFCLFVSGIACLFVYVVFVYALGIQLPLGVLRNFIFRYLM